MTKATLRISDLAAPAAVDIRVRGRVQGVGFRPMVWRIARELGLRGNVLNDAEGVLIRAAGKPDAIEALIGRLNASPPPLASIKSIEVSSFEGNLPESFNIVHSHAGLIDTETAPDAAVCPDCIADVLDPFSRRYRYPFTTCTNCGPRLSIVQRVPYDRANTSMAAFDLCSDCAREYADPADRRFHAETTACHACGPRAKLIRFDDRALSFDQFSMLDDVDAALSLIQRGEIVAIKGLGGYQVACDATNTLAVGELRRRKQRDRKPFALMARDVDVICRYCTIDDGEEEALKSAAAPIVLLKAGGPERLPDDVAPGLNTLGFMLPNTPLHVLLLKRMNRPVVMTSGNLSHAPQVISDRMAAEKLSGIAPFALVHDREIVNRVDDSVVRFAGGQPRFFRRARGYAPAEIALPAGLSDKRQILALGGDLKCVFAIAKSGAVVLSQHIGDLDEVETADDLNRTIGLYREMHDATPDAVVCDLHPGYHGSRIAKQIADKEKLPLVKVQHHHAHVASCLAENGRAIDAPPVLGIALDGLGYGSKGEIWGGEFLLADYEGFARLGTFKPIAMLGGDQASREPWRNLYAHLMAEMGWGVFAMNFAELPVYGQLTAKPRHILDAMLRSGLQAPKASSCGRLFDAVAAAVGICFDEQDYEGEAAARLESIVDEETLNNGDPALDYPFAIPNLKDSGLPYVEPLAVWNAILGDLILKTSPGVIAARFHRGLANAIRNMTLKLARRDSEDGARFDTVAISGGCFNNRILFERVTSLLEMEGFNVLSHTRVPAGDGGLALGQIAVALAQNNSTSSRLNSEGGATCALAFQAGS